MSISEPGDESQAAISGRNSSQRGVSTTSEYMSQLTFREQEYITKLLQTAIADAAFYLRKLGFSPEDRYAFWKEIQGADQADAIQRPATRPIRPVKLTRPVIIGGCSIPGFVDWDMRFPLVHTEQSLPLGYPANQRQLALFRQRGYTIILSPIGDGFFFTATNDQPQQAVVDDLEELFNFKVTEVTNDPTQATGKQPQSDST